MIPINACLTRRDQRIRPEGSFIPQQASQQLSSQNPSFITASPLCHEHNNIMGFFSLSRNKNKSTSSSSSNPHMTIERLRESLANAERREKHVNYQIAEIVREAKLRSAQGDKKGALSALKRKKLYQAELDKIANIKMTLETQAFHIESAAYNQETVQAMKSGQSAMSRLRKLMGVEKVENLMDDIREEADLATEINTAIGTPLDPYMEDDAELLAELNALEGRPAANKASTSFFMTSPTISTTPAKNTLRPQQQTNKTNGRIAIRA